MYGDGSDGALNVTSGTTNLALNTKHQFTTVNVASGATLSTSSTTGSVLYILATTSVVINGTINVSNKVNYGNNTWGVTIDDEEFVSPGVKPGAWGGDAAGGTGGSGSSSGYGGGGAGGNVSQSGNGGNGGTSPVAGSGVSNRVLSSGGTLAVNGGNGASSGGGGGGVYIERNSGGSGNNQASGGAGGGSHGANGGNATSSTSSDVLNQSNGGGGGGAGGRAGSAGVHVVIRSPSITVNGSIITSGTNGQNGGNGGYGAVQNTSPTTDSFRRAGGGGGGGGGNAGNIYLGAEAFNTSSGTFTMSGGSGGSAGAGYTFGYTAENGVNGEAGTKFQGNPNGAEYVKIGTFTLNGGVSGTLDVTGIGFRPGAVYVWMIPPVGTDAISIFQGASDGVNSWANGGVSTSRAAQSRTSSTSYLIYRTSTGGSTVQQAATVSWLDDGFRLNIAGTTTRGYNWGYMAFHEDVDVKVGTFTPSGTGAGSHTGVGFQPNGMIVSWVNGTSATMATAIGFVDSDLNQHGYSGGNGSGGGSYTHHTPGNAFAVASTGAAGTGAVTAWLSNGFSYNFSLGGTFEQCYIAFGRQIKSKLGSFSTPSTTPVSVTGVGFEPTGAMFFPYINTVTTYGYAWGLGAADKYLNQSVSAGGGYNNGTTIHNRYGSITDALGRTGYGTAEAPFYVGRITSFDADGFTANRQSAGGGGENWLYYAFKRNYDEVTITGKLSIRGETSQEMYGNMRLNGSTAWDIGGVTRIQKNISRTQTGKLSVRTIINRFITGRASLAEKKYVTIPGRMRISQITARTQLGQMFINPLTDRRQNGKLRIFNKVLYKGIYKPNGSTDGTLTAADIADARAIKRTFDNRGEYDIVDSNDPGIYKQVTNKTGQFK